MEDLNEDKQLLDELKSHFKELNPEIIELLYKENNKDISKTIDVLIENVKLTNMYEDNQKNEELIDDKNIEENDEDSDDNFSLIKDENEKEEKKDDKNEIKIEKENEKDKEKIDEDEEDHVLKFLIELAPFNTKEEIKQKLIEFNFDVDKVISNLLGELDSNDSKEGENKNKINNYLNDDNFKKGKRKKINIDKKPKYRKYDDDKVFEFLEKNKNKNRIDLHGFKLSESMFIVKEKLEQMKMIVKEIGGPQLLIIVTGRGNHSPGGKPILRPNILRWLKRNNYDVNEKDPGALYVVIR